MGQLHPGDLGWRTLIGAEGTARALRVWARDETAAASAPSAPLAIGLLDDGVLRLALHPEALDDPDLAARIGHNLADADSGLFESGAAVVEARGARALRDHLQAHGWVQDDPWVPLVLDLGDPLDLGPLERTRLRVERVGPGAAELWTGVHWSSFRGTPFEGEARDRFVGRWVTMTTGPLAHRAHSLVGLDSHDTPVAVATVWTAGQGRPGLIEPLGVHREHHGRGYGAAITVAAAQALQELGASAASVATPSSNPAAVATYRAAGFVPLDAVPDLHHPGPDG